MQKKSLLLFAIMVMLPFILPACTNNTLHTAVRAPLPANLLVSGDHTVEHAEPFLAVNPRNPHNLLGAAWVYPMPGLSVVHMGTFVSFDGGHSWHDNGVLPLPAGFDDTAAETVIFTPAGTGFVVAVGRQGHEDDAPAAIIVWRTNDGGRSFNPPLAFARGSSYDQSWAAVDTTHGPGKGNIYLAWQDHCRVVFSTSIDGGQSFSPARVISSPVDHCPTFPLIAVGPSSLVHVVYADGPTPIAVKVTTSTNEGQSFDAPRIVPAGASGAAAVKSRFELTSSLAAATDLRSGRLYVAFATAQTSTQHLDVILTSSADNGQTWSTPVRVNGLTNQDDHFQPQLAVAPDGSVNVSYFTLSHGLVSLFLASSTTHGQTFQHNQQITNASWDPARGDNRGFVGERQGLAIGNGSAYLTWNDGRNGPLQIFTAMMPLV